MLKEAVVGTQSLVFTRYHEESVTRIRHKGSQNREFLSESSATTLALSLFVNHVERHALQEGKGRTLSKLGRRGVLLYRSPESWKVVWVCRDGHKDP